ncbi:hypothetical protein D6D02_09420 [Aureobasidium pullulans]|nr:hypothetical protein D6D02_09420 [Aureobasidium pullulans]
MADNIYDEIEIEDMTYDPITQLYTYPCPCGDKFEINIDDLRDGEDIAEVSWHVEENARNTGRTHTGWLPAQGETDFKRRKTLSRIKARTGHSAFLGITFEGSATNIRTERTRTIDCYRQGHRETNRVSYFAPDVLKKTSSSSADATANAKLHALVESGLLEMVCGLRGTADGEVIRRGQELSSEEGDWFVVKN